MKIGLVGPTYVERSLPFDAQRSINLYAVSDPMGKEIAAMYGTPGLSLFCTAGSGPIRAMFISSNGRLFAVSGLNLFEISSLGVVTNLGTLLTNSSICYMTENPTQLFICDGTNGYTLTYASNAFAQVTDADFPVASTATFIDGYTVVSQANTGRFYLSAINNSTSWAALDFATAESSPDRLIRVINALGQLWLLGERTTEIWTNTGDSAFPFQRIAGGKMDIGCLAPASAVTVDNSLFWLSRDENGFGIVVRASGFNPQRISTSPIERVIQDSSNLENIRAYTYQEDGHVFYVLTGGGLPTTLVYDITTQLWHERAYLAPSGEFEQHLACCGCSAFNRFLVGDKATGNIYSMSLDVFSDNGNPLVRERTYTHISDEDRRIRFNTLEIGFETGVGLTTGQGINPQCVFSLSKDGGRTWSNEYQQPIGAKGNYQTKVAFRRLGIAEIMTFKIRVSDPVKVAIVGSYLR